MSVEVVSEDLYFIDSNIWLYIFLPGQDGEKSRIAKELVRRHNANIVLSTQIVNEVVNGLIKHQVMDEPEIREFTRRLYIRYTVHPISESIQLKASEIRERHSFSHWDSLIVSAALESGNRTLYSEDMHDGFIVDKKLKIVNPFNLQ